MRGSFSGGANAGVPACRRDLRTEWLSFELGRLAVLLAALARTDKWLSNLRAQMEGQIRTATTSGRFAIAASGRPQARRAVNAARSDLGPGAEALLACTTACGHRGRGAASRTPPEVDDPFLGVGSPALRAHRDDHRKD